LIQFVIEFSFSVIASGAKQEKEAEDEVTSSEQNDEECDATEDDSSTDAGNIKIYVLYITSES
jgi:hypothetical protein